LSVWSQLAPDEVEQRIRSAVGDRQPLFFAHGQDGVLTATKVVGRFSALLYLVISVSAIFSAGALLNLLSGAVTARERELAIMQVAGARPSDIALGVIADSLILSTLSIISGLIVGALAGHVLCEYFLERFGWFVDYSVETNAVLLPFAAVLAASIAIGL